MEKKRDCSIRSGDHFKDDLVFRDILAPGTFSDIYEVANPIGSKVYALKIMCSENEVLSKNRLAREYALLSGRTVNRHLPRMYSLDIWENSGTFFKYLMMEKIDGISLEKCIKAPDIRFSYHQILIIAHQICDVLDDLHGVNGIDWEKNGVVHRNVNPSHIILGTDGSVRLVGFGSALRCGAMSNQRYFPVDPPYKVFILPDVMTDVNCSEPMADLYSLGIILYFLGLQKYAVNGEEIDSIPGEVKKLNHFQDDRFEPELNHLIAECTETSTVTAKSIKKTLEKMLGQNLNREVLENQAQRTIQDLTNDVRRAVDGGNTIRVVSGHVDDDTIKSTLVKNEHGVFREILKPIVHDTFFNDWHLQGNKIGTGIVEKELGYGGMAIVVKTRYQELDSYRAVKILFPDIRHIEDRFLTEAKITAKLRHPNIAQIHSVGKWNVSSAIALMYTGQPMCELPFFEMEFVDGKSLDELIGDYGPLPQHLALYIAATIAKALTYIHNAEIIIDGKLCPRIIHRDIKPANIMIASDGTVKLMDFGIARPETISLHTIEGTSAFKGTELYASPEQLFEEPIDRRTDIYSLGLTLYQMLTGRMMFEQTQVSELRSAKRNKKFIAACLLNQQISPSIRIVLSRCIAIDVSQRYHNSQELADDLMKFDMATQDELVAMMAGKVGNEDVVAGNFIERTEGRSVGNKKHSYSKIPVSVLVAGAIFIMAALVFLSFYQVPGRDTSTDLVANDKDAAFLPKTLEIHWFDAMKERYKEKHR